MLKISHFLIVQCNQCSGVRCIRMLVTLLTCYDDTRGWLRLCRAEQEQCGVWLESAAGCSARSWLMSLQLQQVLCPASAALSLDRSAARPTTTLQHCCSDGDGDPNSPVISDPAVLSISVSTLQCASFSPPRNQSIRLTVPRGSDNMFQTMISDVDKSDILFAGLACAHSF